MVFLGFMTISKEHVPNRQREGCNALLFSSSFSFHVIADVVYAAVSSTV